jgi:integrase
MASVYRRKSDGRWVVAAVTDGKLRSRYFKTEEEARASIGQGVADTGTLGHFVETWLASKKDVYRASTYELRRQLLPRFIRPIAHLPLVEVTPVTIASTLAASSLKSSRKSGAYSMLRVCLKDAVAMGLTPENPALRVPKPGHKPSRKDYWTREQARQFLAAADGGACGPVGLFPFLLLTGLRISEALGLEWRDVDLGRGRVTIARALVYNVGLRHVEEAPKTKAGHRTIALPSEGLSVLRKRRKTTTGQGRVFTTRFGHTPDPANLRRSMRLACKAARVPYVSIHGLRHVHAMLALEATGDVYAVQRRLGHANVAITVGIYGYSKREDTDTATAIDKLLS